jgi:hypothetical protein
VERRANPYIEKMLNVFDLHLSTPEEKAVSRTCAYKTRRNLQTFGWCLQFQTVMPLGYTILLLSAENKAGKINTTGQVVLRKNVSEKISIINPL